MLAYLIDGDNHYVLEIIDEKYYVSFRDNNNKEQTIEVTREVFDTFDEFELSDKKQMNEFDRHLEHSYLTDEKFNNCSTRYNPSVEEDFISKEEYKKILDLINKLLEPHKKRFKMFFYGGYSETEIAKLVNVSRPVVFKSIEKCINLLKKAIK